MRTSTLKETDSVLISVTLTPIQNVKPQKPKIVLPPKIIKAPKPKKRTTKTPIDHKVINISPPASVSISVQNPATVQQWETLQAGKSGVSRTGVSKPGQGKSSQSKVSAPDMSAGLKSLAGDLNCLNGFDVPCKDVRNEVMAEYQLTETEKVWMPQYAHSGLSSEYFGLSEREIRQKLGHKFAGENGVFIPFTNIGFDGPLWDRLQGVKKGCKLKITVAPVRSGKSGSRQVVKECPKYQGASRKFRLGK